MPCFHQLLQVILERPTLLSGMPLIPMIGAIQILVPFGWVSAHLIKPAEMRLMLDLLQDFIYRLLKK